MVRPQTLATLATILLPNAFAQNFFVMYTPGGDDTAVERIDPIMSPGGISQHVHQLFGANKLAPTLSYESLQESDCTTVGSAAGDGNKDDHSIYWHPALFMAASDGSGYVRVPTNGHKVYYINTGTGDAVEPFEYPKGFRMVAGNPYSRVPDASGAITWSCFSGGGENSGTSGAFPKDVSSCETYPYFNGQIEFPHCWNGNAYDPANPNAHMSYPEGNPRTGACPSSHPKRLPHLFLENLFNLDSVSGVKANSFVLAQGDNTGYGWHADFFNGWAEGALSSLLSDCQSEDAGTCSNFHAGSSTSSCSLPVTYKENVDTPSPDLPGCNPISDTNPAPMYAIAALGANTDSCKLASNGGSGTGSPSSSTPTSSVRVSSAPSGGASTGSPAESGGASSYAASPTVVASTFATVTSTYAAGSTGKSGSSGHKKKHGGHHHHHKHHSYQNYEWARPTATWWRS